MQKIKHLFIKINTPAAIILAAVIIGISHIGYAVVLANTTNKTPLTQFKGKNVDENDLAVGKTKSDVIVVEYSDTECPFCARLHPTISKIEEDYKDKVSFVYRYFPLTQIHPNSFEESRSVYCVGKLLGKDKRHEYINNMFSYKIEKDNMVLPKGTKETMAKNVGVNEADYNNCMKSNESSDVINTSIQDGVAAGVQGTPATFVLVKNKKGYDVVSLIDGARPYEFFKAVIDEALAR